jgi:hypothetical protein
MMEPDPDKFKPVKEDGLLEDAVQLNVTPGVVDNN